MNTILAANAYFVKEHIGMFKASNSYDIYNPETQEMIMTCREEKLNFFTKILRFTEYKRMTPFNVVICDIEGNKILTVKRGISIILSTVEVLNEKDQLVGKFKQKLFSVGGKFDVLGLNDEVLCTLKGKWTSWDFKFVKEQFELGRVTKKWSGLGKELFTSADNYILKIDENVPAENPVRLLILGAVMCIDMVLKE